MNACHNAATSLTFAACLQSNMTVLMKAAMWGQIEVVKVLLRLGADLRHRDLFGMTTFLRAAYAGQLDMVKFLITQGANVLDVDHVSATILAFAERFEVLSQNRHLF